MEVLLGLGCSWVQSQPSGVIIEFGKRPSVFSDLLGWQVELIMLSRIKLANINGL